MAEAVRWRVIVKFNRNADVVMPIVREYLWPLGLDLWWIPKLGY